MLVAIRLKAVMGVEGIFFRVEGWAAWAPGRTSAAEWLAWAEAQGEAASGSDQTVPSMLRRRVTPIGQQALRAAWSLGAMPDRRVVLSSRHGEFSRTLSILQGIVLGEPLSPAEFSLSVHHALAGLLSIAASNRRGHTTVSAGAESFCCGMLEAAACLAESPGKSVLLVYYDEPLPSPYDAFGRGAEETIALAVCLGPIRPRDGVHLHAAPASGQPASLTPGQDFLGFLLGSEPRLTIAGDRLDWHWEKLDAAA